MTEYTIKTFARRIARSLRPMQTKLLTEVLPSIKIDSAKDIDSLTTEGEALILEIGFGNGEFTADYAASHPGAVILGAEPFLNGVASLMDKIVKRNISNIRIFPDDVKILLGIMPKSVLDTIFIICPDPWPKARHNKRRLVQTEFLDSLAQYLKPNGRIVVATDHDDYSIWIAEHITLCKNLKLNSKTLPDDWLYTKYQRRGLAMGAQIKYFELLLKA